MLQDARGLELNTTDPVTIELYNRAIDEMLTYRRSFGKSIAALIEHEPDFIPGHLLQGYAFCMYSSQAFLPKAALALEKATDLSTRANAHEKDHLRALSAWVRGDLDASNLAFDDAIYKQPTDILALRLQHGNAFWAGKAGLLRDGGARALDAWDESMPHYGNLLGMISFGLEECGEYARAETMGREAVRLNPDDLWAVHSVAHVLEMQARFEEGEDWLSYAPDAFEDRNPFRGHIWWHRALFLFEQQNYEGALALYDRSIRTERSDFYLDIQNQASLLTRLELRGVNIGDRWKDLADFLESRVDDHVLAFTDLHAAMALTADNRTEATDAFLSSLEDFAGTPQNTAASTMEDITIPVCRALQAFRQQDPATAVRLLLPIRYDLHRVGGSHAQRDIFHMILLEAAIRSGQLALARALTSERMAMKEHSKDNWIQHVRVQALSNQETA